MINFVIPGEAVPQLRPRFVRKGNHVRTYDPEKCVSYKAYVRMIAAEHKPAQPLDEAVMFIADIYKSPPASWSEKKKQKAIENGYVTTKPDLDNIVKGIKDALKGLIWRDDSLVVLLKARKFYSSRPRVEVIVATMDEMENKEEP